MKRIVFVCIALVSGLVGFNSCKEDIDLTGDSVETAVVVGLLNKYETAQYIKVTRAFIGDGGTSSLVIAQNPDSSYFNDVEVVVTEILASGAVGRTFTCHDTIIPNKDENGVFYAPEQKVYVFYTPAGAGSLIDDATYKLDIKIDGGRIHVEGETELVNGMKFTNGLVGNTKPLNFYNANSGGSYRTQNIELEQTGNAKRLNAKVKFSYREYTSFPSTFEDKSIIWNLGDVELPSGATNYTYQAEGAAFYEFIKNNIPVSASIVDRQYTAIEIQVTGASEDLSNYMAVNQPSNSLTQNKPNFTNLTVNEGFKVIGIFSSRRTLVEKKVATASSQLVRGLDKRSTEHLCQGAYTIDLNFCSNHELDSDFNPAFYCP